MVSGSEGQNALEQFQISVIALCECLGQAWKQKEFSLLSVSEKLNRQTQSYLRYSDYPLASHLLLTMLYHETRTFMSKLQISRKMLLSTIS